MQTKPLLFGLVLVGVCVGLAACDRLAPKPYRWTWGSVGERVDWLNIEKFATDPINEQTLALLMELGNSRAMDLLDDLEKHTSARDSNNYLRMAARWQGVGKDWASSAELVKFHRMVDHLNNEVFPDVPLDERAIGLLATVDIKTALMLSREMTEKVASIWNPGEYIAKRLEEIAKHRRVASSPSEEAEEEEVEQFWDTETGWEQDANAEEETWHDALTAEAESPAQPSAAPAVSANVTFFRAYLSRISQLLQRVPRRASRDTGENGKIRMRAEWMNRHLLGNRPIDDAAVEALMTLSVSRAMELYEELEAIHILLKSPSNWLQARVAREHDAWPSMLPAGQR